MSATDEKFAQFFDPYMEETRRCLEMIRVSEVESVVESLWQAYRSGNRVWVAGNGGSAATAIHLACCLSQGTMVKDKPPFRAEALVSNISFLTAVANDHGYDQVFTYQLKNCMSANDVFIAISCSGNSPNVVTALDYAKSNGGHTIAFVGFGGGKLKDAAHQSIYINNYNYGQVETIHLHLAHLISQYLKQRIESA